jgi:hypothetical protein
MADDFKMPSEDEDFDAVHTGAPIMSDFDDNAEKSGGTSVKVITDDEESEAEADKPETTETEEAEQNNSDSSSDTSSESEPAETTEPDTASDNETQPETEEQPSEEATEQPADSYEEPAESSTNETESSEVNEMPTESVPAETEPLPVLAQDVSKPPKQPKVKQPGSMGNFLRLTFEVVLFVAVVGLGLLAWQLSSDKANLTKQLKAANANPQTIIQKQTDDLIQKVSKLIQLPTGETPTIANVSDAAQAKKQSAFFANAKNGDKVLMYVKAGEAILYRPSTNKIVLVAPLTFTNNASPTSTNPAGTTSSTVKH